MGEDAYSWQDPRNKSREEIFKPCGELKHVFQRCARDCPDVTFLNLYLDGSPEAEGLREHLGVTTVPSLVFRKEGRKVWEHKGAVEAFVAKQPEGTLSVVQIAQNNAVGCIRIYPRCRRWPRTCKGSRSSGASWPRGRRAAAMELLKVKEVPT